MISKLRKNPSQIPQPTRDYMMNIFQKSWDKVYSEIDNKQAFKTIMTSIALDTTGSEDHLASKKLIDLVGTEMKEFREKLLKTKPAESLKTLRSKIIKPEGVRMYDSELFRFPS